MSQSHRITTCAKNATQRPGLQLRQAEADAYGTTKRRTKEEKAADDQRLKDAKKAQDAAVQSKYQKISGMQDQMRANQERRMQDVPKPSRPKPRQIKRSTQAPVEDINLKPTDGKISGGHKEDKTYQESSNGIKAQKSIKAVIRDAIHAAGGTVIDESAAQPRDVDVGKSQISTSDHGSRAAVVGRIQGWGANVPLGVKPSARDPKLSKSSSLSSSSVQTPFSSAPSSIFASFNSGGTLWQQHIYQ
ncbi:hypothetical protein BJ138DRAFT_1118988 [Hygrophoropsis aurantiaca]|uniref:Uncharacterized protein n=1 Tax=Hygrophoropsis aurantiaca TaxID=72124 RepID=A0ACB7ZUN8_9AGAM|nr:hypothetical protein BJ138DRAFT_1118988 [Hygrophoropsis aurantiaca]